MDLPTGTPTWIADWVDRCLAENRTLLANGCESAMKSRCRVLVSFLEAYRHWLAEELTTEQCAQEVGTCEETIRRGARSGGLMSSQNGTRGPHHIQRGDLHEWNGTYDPILDAIELNRKKKK